MPIPVTSTIKKTIIIQTTTAVAEDIPFNSNEEEKEESIYSTYWELKSQEAIN